MTECSDPRSVAGGVSPAALEQEAAFAACAMALLAGREPPVAPVLVCARRVTASRFALAAVRDCETGVLVAPAEVRRHWPGPLPAGGPDDPVLLSGPALLAMAMPSLVVPVLADGRLLGMVAVAGRTNEAGYNADDRTALGRLAELLALALEREGVRFGTGREKATRSAVAAFSHALRNPLNTIIGFAEIMDHQLFGPLGDSHYRDYARYIGDSGRHLLALATDLLELTGGRGGDGVEAMVAVRPLADAVLAQVAPRAAAAGVLLSADWPAEPLPQLRADPPQLRRILFNLLASALAFTPTGGRITLTARPEAGGSLSLIITDSGAGPADSPQPQLSRLDGLELSLARALAERHGACLSLISNAATGCVATLCWPAERVGC